MTKPFKTTSLAALMLVTALGTISAHAATDAADKQWADDTAVENGTVPRIDAAKLSAPTRRCGWWDNPTLGNVVLIDRDGQWTIGMQGMYSAGGEWPDFKPGQVLPVEPPHGHGCACITARVDAASKFVYDFTDATAQSPKVCRADRALKGKEPSPR